MTKTTVLILVLLWFPIVLAITIGAMIYAMKNKAARPRGLREFAVVGGLIVAATFLIPLLILLRAF